MPPGIPVATVALDGAKNAGILAAQIIGSSDAEVRNRITAYKNELRESVLKKADNLENKGYKDYTP